jgi:hypothetical protein
MYQNITKCKASVLIAPNAVVTYLKNKATVIIKALWETWLRLSPQQRKLLGAELGTKNVSV